MEFISVTYVRSEGDWIRKLTYEDRKGNEKVVYRPTEPLPKGYKAKPLPKLCFGKSKRHHGR